MINSKDQPDFPGFDKPSIDFDPVRDQRRSTLLYLDVDLTDARSMATGTALFLNLAGNSFYVDQDLVNVGNAVVHFQDTVSAGVAPVYVTPGFIANVPFTQLVIENLAQAGKRLRIFYGVDIDFQAGINAQVSISGTINAALTQASISPHNEYASSYKSMTSMAANTPDTVFTPAANTGGAIIWSAAMAMQAGAADSFTCFIAKNAAPASIIDGDVIVGSQVYFAASNTYNGELKRPVKIAAGKGLYYISKQLEGVTFRHCNYTLL